MKTVILSALLALASSSKVGSPAYGVQKVVQLMSKMLEKGKEEKHGEQVQFAAHKKFCDDTSIEKRRAIADAQEASAVLMAESRKYTADAAHLSRGILEIDDTISVLSSSIKANTNVRNREKTDNDATHKSYSATSDALERAIAVLKAAASNRKVNESMLAQASTYVPEITVGNEWTYKIQTERSTAVPRTLAVLKKAAYKRRSKLPAYAQVMNKLVPKSEATQKQKDASWAKVMKKLIPDAARRAIDIFLEQGESEAEDLGSIWHKLVKQGSDDYDFHSSEVIELLGKLSDRFIDERATLEKQEMNSQQDYEMLMQDLKGQISQATKNRGQKSENKAKKLQALADATGDLKDTTTTMQTDQKYMSDLTTTCQQTASAFTERQQMRTDEITAIEKAIDIISGNAVAGNAEKHLCTTSQTDSSFAQLRSSSDTGPHQVRVAKYLQTQAAKLNSFVLESMATHVSEHPFAKAQQMVKDLIARLVEGEHEEAEHQGWCHTALSTNEQTRNEKSDQVDYLHAEIDQLQASISKITEHISDFSQAVAEIDTSIAEATKLRTLDKTKNIETISDAQEAQNAVRQALKVLKELYAKADKSTVYAQQKVPSFLQLSKVFASPYKGMQTETNSVVGMLEVIEGDFARLESETKTAEVSAQKDYDEFMTDSTVDKSQKSADIQHKIAKKLDASQTLIQKNKELEGAQKNLNAALAYFDKLKPSCIESGFGYEDRAGRRKQEIESLQVALRMFN